MNTLSIIVPVFNEENNLKPLYKELALLKKKIPFSLEFIFVNDGSKDKSREIILKLQKKDKRINLIEFTGNFGQTASFDAGIKMAKGEIIATMDADLQNDPSDIPELLKKLNQGYDVVCGWRKTRKDNLGKKLFSYLANKLRRSLTGEEIHDSGCSLRVYKRHVFEDIDLYGEMHRFIPAILSLKGYKITEVPVGHRERRYGKSKYGVKRLLKGLFDLFFIVFLLKFSSRPLHIFGSLGVVTFATGFLIGGYLTILKMFYGAMLSQRPLLILSVLLIVLGVQFFIFGILAEILIRIYFKTHKMRPYTVRK